jgi:hypothetical protein
VAYKKLDIGEPRDLRTLTQYVAQEFDRVGTFLRAAQGAATILQTTPGVQKNVDTTPTLLDEFAVVTPPFEFFAVRPSLPDNGVWARRPGMYMVNFTVQGSVALNREYEITLHNNGVDTLLSALSHPSNQTDEVTMVATGSQRLRATGVGGPGIDDLMQLFITADQLTTWTTLNAFLTLSYAAE